MPPSPEIRINKISSIGEVSLGFTSNMQFPDNVAEQINDKKEHAEKLIEIIMFN